MSTSAKMTPRADEKKADATAGIVATRTLKRRDGKLVALRVHMPVREPGNDWVCTISERVGRQAPRAIVNARGIDSVQALLVAFIALRKVLAKDDHKLTWLGEPGALGLPLVTLDDDPDFLNIIEALIESEYARRSFALKRMRTALSSRATKE